MQAAYDTPPALDVFVPGRPSPGGSKRAFNHATTGKIVVLDMGGTRTKVWRKTVAQHAKSVFGNRPLLTAPLELWVTFFVARPLYHRGTGRNHATIKPNAPKHPTKPPDTTKLLRALEDALTGVIYADDSLIVAQHASKVYSDRVGAHIVVKEMT